MADRDTRNIIAFNFLRNLKYPVAAVRKSILRLNGLTDTGLAHDLGVSRPSVSQHISDIPQIGTNPEILDGISEKVGIPAETMFNDKIEFRKLK